MRGLAGMMSQSEEKWRADMLEQVYAIRKLLEQLIENRTAQGESYSVVIEPDEPGADLCYDRTDSLTSGG